MNVLMIDKITKGYGDRILFDQVTLGIEEGDKLGLIGINGTGKSTLLKIIAGLESADKGGVIRNREYDIAYLEQNPRFEQGDTILNYVIKDKKSTNENWSIEAEGKTILTKLGINDYERVVEGLSGGEKKRIALARTLVSPAKILIMDEPTNHLDSSMVMWLEEYLGKFKGVLIMVTHDRYFLDRVTNKIIEIDNEKLYSYDGNYSRFLELRQLRIDSDIASNRKRQSILRTELEWVKRGARARSTKQKARLERYDEMKNIDGPSTAKKIELDSVSSRLGKKTIEIDHIAKWFGDRCLIRDFTYYTVRDERIGIVGINGCGKSTLLKLILGQIEPDSGTVTLGETLKIGYFSQENEEMNKQERVIDYIRNVAEFIETTKGLASASQMLERFLFTPVMQYTSIDKLSGGEQRRLFLLKILMGAPNILILDEPTNDLDIATLTILEDYLDGFAGIVITVSHDRYFLDRIVDRILAFSDNGDIVQYEGGYTDYLDKLLLEDNDKEEKSLKDIDNQKDDTKNNWKKREEKVKFTYLEKKEYDTIDEDIHILEENIDAVDKEILLVASQYTKLDELTKKKNDLEYQLEQKMERWLYLNDLAEQINNQ